MKMYDWVIYWTDDSTTTMAVPFGPDSPYIIKNLESEWVDRLETCYPKFRQTLANMPFKYIVVNPPREAVPEEEHHWNKKGYK